ncbi:Hypothetical predicted protein [Lecanosticta acicola]|uniref:PXA domain-containing protein n=1 Tax=Lecanosticta acicola TaxID=111012 RepID=A0AAI9EDE6_9PEZI|nr:Hypothetical predicted protein [Lecanosticta acicola]
MAQSMQKPIKQQPRNAGRGASQQQHGYSRPGHRIDSPNAISDAETIEYIKRVLCAKQQDGEAAAGDRTQDHHSEPLEELLPPLTSSNAIDIQLYAFIAVILSNFVQTWYNRITPDQHFVAEIVQIIAHCTRGLEQRLRKVDLEALLLDELPDLLTEHVNVVRATKTSRQGQVTLGQQRIRFHTMLPHVALEPVPLDPEMTFEQQENEVAWCLMLVNRILPLLLPPEDLANPCLDVLVPEIFSEIIVRNALCGKATEPWLLWDGLAKLLRSVRSGSRSPTPNALPTPRLEQYGLLNAVPPSADQTRQSRSRRPFEGALRLLLTVAQYAMTAGSVLRACTVALMQASSIPARRKMTSYGPNSPRGRLVSSSHGKARPSPPATSENDMERQPIISMHIWECIGQLLSLNRRMPWLSGVLSLLQWISLCGPGQIGSINSRLDRLISLHLHTSLLNANWLPTVLQAARSAIFPDNALAPARTPPSKDEVVEIKRECANTILDAIPESIRIRFFATKDRDLMREDVEAELDLLGDSYLNKHLIIAIVELVVVRLFPELAAEDSANRRER